MSETEITLARAYLLASGQDPVGALIRSVRDVARLRRAATAGPALIDHDGRPAARPGRQFAVEAGNAAGG